MAFDLKVSGPYAVHQNWKSFINLSLSSPCPQPSPLSPPKKKPTMISTSLSQYFGHHFNNVSRWKIYKNLLLQLNLHPFITI